MPGSLPGLPPAPSRRAWLALAVLPAAASGLPAWAAPEGDPPAFAQALARFAGGAPVREGRVQLELPELVENGNAVPVTVWADSPMTAADHVAALALFAAGNPAPEVGVFHLGPASARARVSTRMRLATSQTVLAAARLSDGSVWIRRAGVLVTLAACVEG